jgi:hypothetical protein
MNKKEYRVHGCTQRYDETEGEIIVAPVDFYLDEEIEPEFWVVYEVGDDGVENWVARFRCPDDAEMFALEKQKQDKAEARFNQGDETK